MFESFRAALDLLDFAAIKSIKKTAKLQSSEDEKTFFATYKFE